MKCVKTVLQLVVILVKSYREKIIAHCMHLSDLKGKTHEV